MRHGECGAHFGTQAARCYVEHRCCISVRCSIAKIKSKKLHLVCILRQGVRREPAAGSARLPPCWQRTHQRLRSIRWQPVIRRCPCITARAAPALAGGWQREKIGGRGAASAKAAEVQRPCDCSLDGLGAGL